MIIGVPRETHRHEHRVGLAPFAVARLVKHGHAVVVERQAGASARFLDTDYERAGAQIVHSPEEVYMRPDIVCRFGLLSSDELELLKPGSTISAFHHLAVSPPEVVRKLMELEVTIIGYELVRDRRGDLALLPPFSEMAGQMAVQLAAKLLQIDEGGRGILLGNVPGVPPPTVLVLGAGNAGLAAARQALASGAHVILVDENLDKLREANRQFAGRVVTVAAGVERLEHYTSIADVLIGAVLIPGGRTPFVITRDMVRGMKPGSVIIDVSVDQGGCVETSRPTTLDTPTFISHDVVHYCVPNLLSNIARTASRVLSHVWMPYLMELADKGLEQCLRDDWGLAAGVYLHKGKIVNERAAETLGIEAASLDTLIRGVHGQ